MLFIKNDSVYKKILRPNYLIVLGSLLFSLSCNSENQNQENSCCSNPLIDSLFIKESNLNFDYISSIQGVAFEMPIFSYYYNNISQIPDFSKSINKSLLNFDSFQSLTYIPFRLLGSSAGGFGPPATVNEININNEEELLKAIELSGLLIDKSNFREWSKLPFNLRKDIAELYLAIDKASFVLNQFSNPLKDYLKSENAFNTNELYNALISPWKNKELLDFTLIDLLDEIDLKKLSYASRIISEKLNAFLKYKNADLGFDFSECQMNTKHGKILINGINNDTINDNYLLVIELGGDDLYRGTIASTISINQTIGIVIDFNGDDKYLSNEGFLVAGILGYSSLIDLSGNDEYSAKNAGLAFSLFGTSVLYDFCGNDTYTSNTNYSQGAAIFGTATLIDLIGDDKYSCKAYSQAFGGTLGVGCFIDCQGNDLYNADTIKSNKVKNLPDFVQGSAKGRWAEATDGQSLAGGLGIFVDASGDDIYFANSFSQGASYYFGLGIFNDNSGDDEFNALSHSQGYAAHFSLANFIDKAGDDKYNIDSDKEKLTQIIGSGRDLSAGIFIDYKGNDLYTFGNRSLAIGDMNAIGVMIDHTGDDTYNWIQNNIYSSSPSVGKTFDIPKGMSLSRLFPVENINQGIFIDNSGNDYVKQRTIKD